MTIMRQKLTELAVEGKKKNSQETFVVLHNAIAMEMWIVLTEQYHKALYEGPSFFHYTCYHRECLVLINTKH